MKNTFEMTLEDHKTRLKQLMLMSFVLLAFALTTSGFAYITSFYEEPMDDQGIASYCYLTQTDREGFYTIAVIFAILGVASLTGLWRQKRKEL